MFLDKCAQVKGRDVANGVPTGVDVTLPQKQSVGKHALFAKEDRRATHTASTFSGTSVVTGTTCGVPSTAISGTSTS